MKTLYVAMTYDGDAEGFEDESKAIEWCEQLFDRGDTPTLKRYQVADDFDFDGDFDHDQPTMDEKSPWSYYREWKETDEGYGAGLVPLDGIKD